MVASQEADRGIWSTARTCGACGSPDQREQFEVYGRWFVRCEQCGLVRLRDRIDPTHLGILYGDYYPLAARRPTADVLQSELANPTFAFRRQRIERHLGSEGRSMFELGAGDGNFLRYLQSQGWSVGGTEFTETTAALVRSRHDIELIVGDLGDVVRNTSPRPVVGAYHVIEHVYEPAAWLMNVRALVAKGGLLHLQTPNFASLDFRIAGTAFAMLSFPQHVYLYTPAILKRLLAEHGFETVGLTTYDPWHSPWTVIGSAGNLVKHKLTGQLPWPRHDSNSAAEAKASLTHVESRARPRPIVHALRRLLHPLAVGIARLERAAGRGSVVDIVARAV